MFLDDCGKKLCINKDNQDNTITIFIKVALLIILVYFLIELHF